MYQLCVAGSSGSGQKNVKGSSESRTRVDIPIRFSLELEKMRVAIVLPQTAAERFDTPAYDPSRLPKGAWGPIHRLDSFYGGHTGQTGARPLECKPLSRNGIGCYPSARHDGPNTDRLAICLPWNGPTVSSPTDGPDCIF